MCAREPKRCRAPKTCDSPRDALEKTWIEPRAASLSPPRTHLQHFGGFSSGKREPPASKGNSMCGGSSESSESALLFQGGVGQGLVSFVCYQKSLCSAR